MLSFITWNVNPEAFNLFGREVRWYGICWAVGVLLTSLTIKNMYKNEKLPEKWFDSLFMHVIIGLIIGARLGHCLFYDPVYYLSHPIEIIKIWHGGLASHGGAIGMAIAVWIYSRKVVKKSMIWSLDRLIVGVAIGATFIRLGNLMNSEIYGGPTHMSWGFNFIRDYMWSKPLSQGGSSSLPCHPTQIYEAFTYLCIYAITMFLYWKTNAKNKQGLLLGISLVCIFVARFVIEIIKNVQEPFEVSMKAAIGINMGQLLSLPFIIWGLWLIWNATIRKKTQKLK